MLPESALKDLLAKEEYSRTEKVLICLGAEADQAKAVKRVREIGRKAGLRVLDRWNVSGLLSGSKGLAIRTEDGWELTTPGRDKVRELGGMAVSSPAPTVAAHLRKQLAKITDPEARAFVEEAVKCLEFRLLRAAVVLSWVGALAVLQQQVVDSKLTEFNTEATRRDARWKKATKKDDLSRMKEFDFLNVLAAISVLGKSVKQELEGCLKLRNGSGHPNSLKIGEARVAAHIETLLLNVFSQF